MHVGGTQDQEKHDLPQPTTSSSAQQDEPSITCDSLNSCFSLMNLFINIYLIEQ